MKLNTFINNVCRVNESYSVESELQSCSIEILKVLASRILSKVNVSSFDLKNGNLVCFLDRDIPYEKYKSIYNFVKNTNIHIFFDNYKSNVIAAYVSDMKQGRYFPDDVKNIRLSYTDNAYSVIRDHVLKKSSTGSLLEYLKHVYLSVLVHELKHAFDDYRSKSRIYFNDVYYKDVIDSVLSKDSQDDRYVRYMKSEPEVWARFSEAILKTRIDDFVDFIESSKINDYINVVSLVDINLFIRKFKLNFLNFAVLTDDQKNRVLKRAMSFYYDAVHEFKLMDARGQIKLV